MELELDRGGESQNESQEEDVQEKRDGGETTSKSSKEEEQRKEDERSTLTSVSESDKELTSQPSKKLKPIPALFDAPLSTKDMTPSADFNLDDPLRMKVMKAALQNPTGSKGPKGPRKGKAATPLKWLAPAIKLAKENTRLKLRGSTPSGYYQ